MQWVSQVKILNQNTCVLLLQINLVRLWASYKKLSLNTTEESHTIGLLSIQIDKYKTIYLLDYSFFTSAIWHYMLHHPEG